MQSNREIINHVTNMIISDMPRNVSPDILRPKDPTILIETQLIRCRQHFSVMEPTNI